MPPATDKADPWGQFLNTFMLCTKGKGHLFFILGHTACTVYFAETPPSYQTMEDPNVELRYFNKMRFEVTAADLSFLMKHLPFFQQDCL